MQKTQIEPLKGPVAKTILPDSPDAGHSATHAPDHVQIETTVRCNLSCVMCPREAPWHKKRTMQDMNLEQFRTIIDMLPSAVGMVSVHGLGEPLLNRNIAEMIAYASRKFYVLLVTNATLLHEAMALKILSANPGCITVSIDSPHKEKYEDIRKGADFDKVLANCRRLVAIREQHTGSIPLRMQMTVSEGNFSDIPEMVSLCSHLGMDGLTVLGIHTDTNQKISEHIEDYEKHIRQVIASAEKQRIALDLINLGTIDTAVRNVCRRPWKTLFINCDGSVNPCCIHVSEEPFYIGNIFESDFEAIWNGARMRSFRRLLASEKKPPSCLHCDKLYQ